MDIGDKPMRRVCAHEAAAYFGADKGSCHRNPTIICHGDGIVVATPLGVREYRPGEIVAALDFFRGALDEIGYWPNAEWDGIEE